MVQEKLAAHEEEGEVVQTPSHKEETAQGVVFDYLGCSNRVSTVIPRNIGYTTYCFQSLYILS